LKPKSFNNWTQSARTGRLQAAQRSRRPSFAACAYLDRLLQQYCPIHSFTRKHGELWHSYPPGRHGPENRFEGVAHTNTCRARMLPTTSHKHTSQQAVILQLSPSSIYSTRVSSKTAGHSTAKWKLRRNILRRTQTFQNFTWDAVASVGYQHLLFPHHVNTEGNLPF